MKKIISILIVLFMFSCSIHTKGEDGKPGEPGKEGTKGKDGENGKDGNATIVLQLKETSKLKEITDGILIGKAKKTDLYQEPFNEWFESGYSHYQPEEEIIMQLKQIPFDYSITIFMGTWCEDSQNQVPKFYKILNEINFPSDKITLITMSRDKTTPELFEKNLNITNVPTFLFFKNKKEMNRIVESPIENLEVDILSILSSKTYKHTYAE